MKNFNIKGDSIFRGGHEKPIYRVELPKKGGTCKDCRFKKGLSKKRGVVFLRGDWYPSAHYAVYRDIATRKELP